MDHEIKEPPPLSSTLCSQPSQFSQNTQETYPRYFQQDLNERKKKGTCFTCGQKDHWYRECPFKSSNNDSQNANSIWCRCGHGRCEKRTSKSEKNPGRMYYVCPIKRGEKCTNGFVKWCDDPDVESDWSQPPPFKYPECKCPAGVCKREKATHNGVVKYYFTCPVKEGHGNCGYKVWEDELLHKRTNDQDDHDFDEGVNLAVNHSKKMRIMDSSEEDPTPMAVSEAELSQSEDEALEKKASQLSCLSESTPSRIGGDRQHVFPRHIFAGAGAGAGADPSFAPLGWLGRLLFNPPQSLKSPSSHTPQSIFCCVFPSFNPIDVPKQPSITNVPCAEHNQLDVIRLSQQSQLSSSERKLMSRAQRQRQLAFAAQKQLLNDLETSKPHEHESMKEAAQDTFAILDNLGANDTQFFEHVLDFIKLTSSVVQTTKSIECLEEDNKRLEDENAKLAHIRDLYAKTEDQFQASDQRRQLLSKEISDFEAMLVEKRNQLKSCELETSNMRIELGGLRRTMLEADTALKARMKQAEIAGKLRKEREAKQIAAKTALEKARLKSEY
ncbi:hypothetical protein JHK86_053075 [Glycine max]|nr:hypothetical protein JHK86_053075 [Glycine max]